MRKKAFLQLNRRIQD